MELIKINAVAAKRLYLEGTTIDLLPSKCVPGNTWVTPHSINRVCGSDFTTIVNAYMYYNCNIYELGRRCSYYIT